MLLRPLQCHPTSSSRCIGSSRPAGWRHSVLRAQQAHGAGASLYVGRTVQPQRTSPAACWARRARGQQHFDTRDVRDLEAQQASLTERIVTGMIKDATSLTELQDVTDEWRVMYNHIHVAAVITRAAHLAHAAKDVKFALEQVKALVPLWLELLPTANARSIANLLWAAGRLKVVDQRLWSASLEEIRRPRDGGSVMQQTSATDVANMMHAVSAIAAVSKGQVPGVPRQKLVDDMRTMMRRLGSMLLAKRDGDNLDFVNIANAAAAMAKLGIPVEPHQLRDLMITAAKPEYAGTANARAISILLWAAGLLVLRGGKAVPLPLSSIEPYLAEAKLRLIAANESDQSVANIVYGLALLVAWGCVPGKSEVREAVQLLLTHRQLSDSWACPAFAIVLWGVAVMGLPVQEYLTPDMTSKLASWLPTATTADVVACIRHTRDGHQLLEALLCGTEQNVVRALPYEAISNLASVGNALAVADRVDLAPRWVALWAARKDVRRLLPGDVASRARPQLQVSHAWLLKQQGPGGRGLLQFLSKEQLWGEAAGAPGAQAVTAV